MNRIRAVAPTAVLLLAVLLAAGIPALGPASAQAQGMDLEAFLQSYGLRFKQEGDVKVVEVSLQQVLRLALERNLALQSVRMGESVSESIVQAARERFNPTLANKVDYGRALAATTSGSPFVTYGGSDGMTLSTTLTKPTESGMEYSLKYSERRGRGLANVIPAAGADPNGLILGEWIDTSVLTGSVKIPLGQDAGSEFNAIPVRRGEAGLAISRASSRQGELDLLQVTALTYWDLVASLENVRVQQDAVKLSEQLLQDNRQRLEAGVLSPFDVQVTETQLARDHQRLVVAQADVLRIEDQARALLNLPVIDFQVRPVDRPHVRPLEAAYPDLQRRVFDRSTALQQLEAQLSGKALDLAEAQNLERTNLDLELFYSLQGADSSPFGGTGQFSRTDLDSYGASLTWTVPLWDVKTSEKVRQRLLERQQVQLQMESRRSELDVSLQSLLRQIRVATEQVDSARRARELADEQLKNEIERFRVGETTSFQVSQSQQAASEARVQEILAQLSFERNYLQLLVLTGDIYQNYGLEPTQR